MDLILIGVMFSAAFLGVAIWANGRYRAQERLPMQWGLGGQVNWSAPRRIALAFIPAISIVMLAGFTVLLANVEPRPGQEGMVIPALLGFGIISLGAQLFHLWMVDRTVRRNSR